MKAILFDLDDTLIPEASALQAGYRAQSTSTVSDGRRPPT